jgi:protocatechuate 3,4-dioxygenase beta subunit
MKKFGLIPALALLASMIGFSVMAETHTFARVMPIRLAEIEGTIRDTHGRPVAALKISLMNWFGIDLASGVTDEKGTYDIRNITPGRYYVNFRPLAEDSRGQVVMIQIPARKIRMNLTISRNPPALVRSDSAIAGS